MANTVIQLKYSNTTGMPPSLNVAEPAYSNVSNKLWIDDGTGVVAIGGKHYTDIIDAANTASTGNTLVKRDLTGSFDANVITVNTLVANTSVIQNGYDLYEFANNAYEMANSAMVAGGQIAGSYANSAYLHANAAYVSQNTTGEYANTAYAHANAAYVSQNTTGVYANTAYLHANAAYVSQNTTGVYANAAYALANTKFASAGGTVSGFVDVTANVSVGSYIDMNTAPSAPTWKEGRVFYDNDEKSLAYYNNDANVKIQLAQEQVARVWNNTATALSDGQAVYILGESSANGFPAIALADASDATKSGVVGVVTSPIAAGGYGFITRYGKVNGLNTSLTPEGTKLYLSATNPGEITATVPPAPAVPVVIGWVANSALADGSVFIDINVADGDNKTSGAVLFAYNGSIYEDPSNFYYDRANNRLGIGTDLPQANLHVTGDGIFSGNVQISGNLIVSNAYAITTQELTVGGNTIILNANVTGSPVANAELIVNRGTSPNAFIRWDETFDEWVIDEGTGHSGHILSSQKTANTWEVYTAMDAYEKDLYPIGANLANATNEHAKAGYAEANAAVAHAVSGYIHANSAYISQNTTGVYANTAYLHANAAYVSQNSTGNYANSAYAHANSSYLHANAAYISQNTTGEYANTAYLHANAAYVSQNTTGSYANSAYLHANAAYVSQNSTGNFANSAYAHANGAYSHANSAYDLANTDVTYLSTTAGIFGSASIVPVFNVAANGRVYDVTNTSIAIDTSQVTSGILPVVRGGTGNNAFTQNHVLIGNGTDAVTTTGSSTEGHVLTISSSGVPTFQHLSGGTF